MNILDRLAAKEKAPTIPPGVVWNGRLDEHPMPWLRALAKDAQESDGSYQRPVWATSVQAAAVDFAARQSVQNPDALQNV